jgi:hypothetical protein
MQEWSKRGNAECNLCCSHGGQYQCIRGNRNNRSCSWRDHMKTNRILLESIHCQQLTSFWYGGICVYRKIWHQQMKQMWKLCKWIWFMIIFYSFHSMFKKNICHAFISFINK